MSAELPPLPRGTRMGSGTINGKFIELFMHSDDAMTAYAHQCLAAQAAEVQALKRWKSTNAPRVAALEGLLHAAQIEAHAGREAIATLFSEREANAILTAELEALRAKLAEWEKLRDPVTLHVSLLRGFPARLPRSVLLHLAGGDAPMPNDRANRPSGAAQE